MKSVSKIAFVLASFLGLSAAPACQPAFPGVESSQRLAVTLTSTNLGSPNARLPISLTAPTTFTVDLQALDAAGNLDTTFDNHYVRLSAVPGAVLSVTGPGANGRNALLVKGQAKGLQVSVVEAFGDTRIWVEDVGYVPADPLRDPPPQCANGKDDNNNGMIDYPVDPGCYAANDDTEDGGSYATAVSDAIYFEYPRIADVRGVNYGGTTPFNNQQVDIATGWVAPNAPGGVVVTGVASSGFYVTDLAETRGYNSLYAYTYTAPPIMLPCDRLITLGGTAGEFYGFMELNYPTWSLEEWDPTVRPCLIPPAFALQPTDLQLSGATSSNSGVLLPLEAALVQVAADDTGMASTSTTIHVGAHFGPGLVPTDKNGVYVPNADASDCDYNGDGKIEYTPSNGPEALCSTACTADVECTEFSNYASQAQFRIVVVQGSTIATVYADASVDASFIPTQYKSQSLGAFTGTLNYFSGGNQFTIQARCADDVIVDPKQKPFPSSCDEVEKGGILVQKDPKCHAACVVARNAATTINAP